MVSPSSHAPKFDIPSTSSSTAGSPYSMVGRPKSHHAQVKDVSSLTCTECGKMFSRIDHRRRHELIHTGDRPHCCHICSFSSTRHDKLTLHLRRKHQIMMHASGKPVVSLPFRNDGESSATEDVTEARRKRERKSIPSVSDLHLLRSGLGMPFNMSSSSPYSTDFNEIFRNMQPPA